MKIDLYLIRHGKTEYNEEKRYAGCKTDCSISEAGRKEVEENKENGRYPTEPYMIFRSPMKRAEETAEIIYPGEEKTVIEDIREIDFGTFEGKNYDELKSILNLFILRRMKKDVLQELPQKSEQIIYCDMEQKQRKLYTGINLAVKKAIMSLKAFAAPVVLKGLTLLRECCCHPLLLNDETNVDKVSESCKLDALELLVDNLVGSGHKILIFSFFNSPLIG